MIEENLHLIALRKWEEEKLDKRLKKGGLIWKALLLIFHADTRHRVLYSILQRGGCHRVNIARGDGRGALTLGRPGLRRDLADKYFESIVS